MSNSQFWDECKNGSIRSKLAEFIDNTPPLANFNGVKYFDLEDAIIDFIRNNREIIYKEVLKEHGCKII